MSDHFLDTSALVKHYHTEVVHGLHTLDALQLAVVLDLAQKGTAAELVTADHVLLSVGPLEGLTVNNPEVP